MSTSEEVFEQVFSLTADASLAGERADVVLAERCSSLGLTLTRSAVQKLIASGNVTVNGAAFAKNYKLRAGDCLELTFPMPEDCDAEPEDIPLEVVYEDRDIIVINKPQGMVVHPAPGHRHGTLVSALLFHCGDSLSGIGGVMRPGIVHRIDRDTSGLICVAKNDKAHLSLAAQLKEHSMHRVYEALCIGRLPTPEGRIDAPIARHRTDRKKMAVSSDGKEAATNYTVLGEYKAETTVSHIECRLETGRTHQIRVHMAHIGHPLLGDAVYGGGGSAFEKRHLSCFAGQALHAKRLVLTHPGTGEVMTFEAKRPENFERALEILKSHT